jgi:hypothetical protein
MTMGWTLGRLPTVVAAAAVAAALAHVPAQALTSKECSAKYKAAKNGGTLGGKTWNDFRKAECGDGNASAEPKPAETAATAKPAAPKVSAGGAVFPTAIAAKYAKETPTKQRFHTCLEQYKANKASRANGGMKWIQKGGGYYSTCNARLKP